MSIKNLYSTSFPSLGVDFANTKRIAPEMQFSRASTGTYVGSGGLIKSAQIGEPRFDYDPVTGECKGLLVEQSRSNLMIRSQDMTTWPIQSSSPGSGIEWIQSNVTIQANSALAPDMTMTANLVTETNSSDSKYVLDWGVYGMQSGLYYTHSVFVKPAGRTTFYIYYRDGSRTFFNLETKSISGGPPNAILVDAGIIPLANGWFRVYAVGLGVGPYNTGHGIGISDGTTVLYQGDSSKGLYFWGHQVEASSFASSYIRTPAVFTSRASTATYYDSTGTLKLAAVNEARSDAHLPDSSGVFRPAGLLLEAAGTNTSIESQNAGTWENIGGQTTNAAADVIAAPDGTLTADNIYGASGAWTAKSLQGSTFTVPNNSYVVMTIFAKKVPSSKYGFLHLNISTSGAPGPRLACNLDTGTVTPNEGVTGYSERLPNGWYRFVAYLQNTSGATRTWSNGNELRIFATTSSSDSLGSGSGTGSTTDGVYLWGRQVEVSTSPYATSYIPTAAATVTRSADTSTSTAVTRVADTLTIPVPPSTSSAQLTLKPSAVNSTSPLATFVGTSGALTSTSLELSTPLASPTIRALSKGIEQTRLVLPAPTNTVLASATAQSLALTLNQSTGAMSLCSSTTDSTALSPIVELSATSGLKLAEPLTTMTIGPCGGLKSVYFWSTPLTTNQLVTLANEQSAAGTTPRVSNGLPFEDLYVTANPAVNGRPTLDLNFAETKTLVDKITQTNLVTFTRASTGTYVGSDGLIKSAAVNEARFDHNPATGESLGLLVEEARTNLFRYSEQFDNAAWINSGRSTQTPNTITSPDGTISADSCIVTVTGFNGSVSQSVSLTSGTTYTLTLYLKYKGFQFVRAGFGIGADFASFDLQSGLVAYTGSNVTTASISTFADGWYRCTVRYVAPSTGTYSVQFFPVDIVSNTYTTVSGTNGVYVWGAQLEAGSFPTSYIPTPATFTGRASTATYYDANGIIQTAASGVARSNAFLPDSSGVMRPAGLLLEAAGTNLLLRSQEIDNTTIWAGSYKLNYSANATTAPDGTTTADKAIPNTENFTHSTFQDPAGTISGTYTFSLYAKASGYNKIVLFIDGASAGGLFGSGSAVFDLSTKAITSVNGSAAIETLPNGWYRCSVTGTSASAVTVSTGFSIYDNSGNSTFTGNGTDGIFIWGAQLETGTYATSYIPTTTATVIRAADTSTSATVTRSADVASMTGTNFLSWYNANAGCLVVNANTTSTNNYQNYIAIRGASFATNRLSLYMNSTGQRLYYVTPGSVTGVTPAINTQTSGAFKVAVAYNLTSVATTSNGSIATTTATNDVSTTFTTFDLSGSDNPPPVTRIARLTYWPTRLPDAQLQAITSTVISTWDVVFDSSIPIDGVCAIITTGIVTYTINWGDETSPETITVATNITSTVTHKYSSPKRYVAKITVTSGAFRPFYSNSSYATHVIEIRQTPTGWTNTSSSGFGTNLSNAFQNASNLRTISKDLNLSGITNLNTTWDGCFSLLNFPLLDTSGCTGLSVTWRNCQSLTSFPLINTSNVTGMGSVWVGCIGLTDFPLIDTSKVTSFSNAWYGCRGLIRFPLLNSSNVTDFTQAWDGGCIGLLSFPALDTSKGSLFAQTWRSCSSLTSFPFINTNSATTFANAWNSCTNLATFPANMFNTCTATNFSQAWNACALTAQSIENIIVSINTANTSNGTLAFSNGTNATKTTWTTAANTAYDALIARGWTITFRP